MFSYKDFKLISAVPIAQILGFMHKRGAIINTDSPHDTHVFTLDTLTIEITLYDGTDYPELGILRHTITVQGEQEASKNFLDEFRLRFLSAGG